MIFILLFGFLIEIPLGLDRFLPVPPDNPLTAEKVALGRKLFFDKRLSRDETVSCATCHDPAFAFSDGAPRAKGIRGQIGPRRTPRIANRAWGRTFFWDGRAATLEQQVLDPIANPLEMDLDPAVAARRLGLKVEDMQAALASYVRTIRSGGSAYDRYLAGNQQALDEEQKEGLALFRGKAGCTNCHLGPNLTDEEFHYTGAGRTPNDAGRKQQGFKTPSLRDVARTPPYMHDGSLESLDAVVDFYNEGGKPHPRLDSEMQPLRLTPVEKRRLMRFLVSLNGSILDGL
ncbi:MAG: c-type cytochrome [Acidobacteria bacterium]|nr:c-type cytochrome [Acidobacteriota bacterium]